MITSASENPAAVHIQKYFTLPPFHVPTGHAGAF